MMRIAVFSDIHSNFTAWQQAFSIMQEEDIDQFLCTGDLVGYGPQPNQVINHIRNRQESGLDFKIVRGNHDQGVINDQSLHRFNSHAKKAIRWTRKELSPANREFLEELPLIWQNDSLLLAHGTPNNPIWEYLRDWNVENIFSEYNFKYSFVGHTHLIQAFRASRNSNQTKEAKLSTTQSLTISSSHRAIINVGSIGQPRDYNPKGSFIILDTDENKIDLIRFQYNIKEVQEIIYNSDLPDVEGKRLAEGR